jgi:hypothetical protein
MIIRGGFVIATPNKPTFSDMLVWNFINMNADLYAPGYFNRVLSVWYKAGATQICCIVVWIGLLY